MQARQGVEVDIIDDDDDDDDGDGDGDDDNDADPSWRLDKGQRWSRSSDKFIIVLTYKTEM